MPKQTKNETKRSIKTPSKYLDFTTSFTTTRSVKEKRKRDLSQIKSKKGTTKERHTFFSAPERSNVMDIEPPKPQDQLLKELGIDNMQPEEYISSSLDKPHLVSVKTVDLLKEHGGRGLIAREFIPAGTCLGLYTGEVFANQNEFNEHFRKNPQVDDSYTMKVGSTYVDALTKGNFTRYANFSDTQDNAQFQFGTYMGRAVAKVVTTKDIQPGTSILIDYGPYDEDATKLYFYLNPEDSDISAGRLHLDNAKHYSTMYMLLDIKAFNLSTDDKLYATEVGVAVLTGKPLSQLNEKKLNASTFDLPYLKVGTSGEILDFAQVDVFTPLMYACFDGQLDNVTWLVSHGVNINRQQHQSGNCPLFFALEGYVQAGAKDKLTYVQILQHLIKSGANILAHDRESKTFVHKAISALSNKDFELIMTVISKQNQAMFASLFGYLDQDDFDVVLRSIKNEAIDKVKILLDCYPDYFATNFTKVKKLDQQASFEEFKQAAEDLSEDERKRLIDVLMTKKYKAPGYLVKALESINTSSMQLMF